MQKIFSLLKDHHIKVEVILLSFYKLFLDLCIMPTYFDSFSYMHGYGYDMIFGKWIVSNIIFILLMLFFELMNIKEKKSSTFILRVYSILCVIPCLSLFSGLECFNWKFLAFILIYRRHTRRQDLIKA